jgi:hypothetical protein
VTEEKETSKEQTEKISESTRAYQLFSASKTPLEVAIALTYTCMKTIGLS